MTIVDEVLPQTQVVAPERTRGRLTAAVFAGTAFLGASLLFLAEPLVAKLLLPDFGGSATVWSTSSLFFQLLLLAAYGYCHLSTRRLGPRGQPGLQLLVLVVPAVSLPLVLPQNAAPGPDGAPAFWLLRTLAVMVGLPFVVVATTGPLLQRWYSWTANGRAHDPYFLFAASNLGSFVGLLAYPLVVESRLSLVQQRAAWSWGYVLFGVAMTACALLALSHGRPTVRQDPRTTAALVALGRGTLLRWLLLAFLPSTLLLGVTSHLSLDVAAIPLLWVVPLAIYLATFVVAFARTSRVPPRRATRWAVALGVGEMLLSLHGPVAPIALSVLSGLMTLALVAYAAHARLAAERPPAEHLTVYYLVISVGGALGGLLNGLLAPSLFPSILEYPLALMAVPLLLIGTGRVSPRSVLTANRVRVACVAVAAGSVLLGLRWVITRPGAGLLVPVLVGLLVLGLAWWLTRLAALPLLVVVSLMLSSSVIGTSGRIEESRTFYGTYRVLEGHGLHRLVHGTTVHGTQFSDLARRREPTTYYARSGPLGDLFPTVETGGGRDIAVVGLGAGTVAAYGRAGERFIFFEIDPEVLRIAEDKRFFTYLADSRAQVRTVTGDGRLGLERQPAASYDAILLDAFSSDAIPVHLMTQQAIEEYLSRLRPGGMLVFHISNRVFDLKPVLAGAADSLDLHAAVGTSNAARDGATPTQWVALSRDARAIDRLRARSTVWTPLDRSRRVEWTDDYSSVLSVLR